MALAGAGSATPTSAPPDACAGARDDPRPALLDELNRRRAAFGVGPLRFSAALCRIAARHAAALARRGDLDPRLADLSWLERETAVAGARADRLFSLTVVLRDEARSTWEAVAAEHPSIAREAAAGDLLDFGAGLSRLEGRTIATLLFSLPRAETLARSLAVFADLEAVRQALLVATNRARLVKRQPPLVRDPTLDAVAQSHAEAMLARRFYAHVDPDGRSLRQRLERAGYRAPMLAENLARGLFAPDEVVERWLASSGHRKNLVSPRYRSIGLGISHDPAGGDQSVHWVQIFSSREADTPRRE